MGYRLLDFVNGRFQGAAAVSMQVSGHIQALSLNILYRPLSLLIGMIWMQYTSFTILSIES